MRVKECWNSLLHWLWQECKRPQAKRSNNSLTDHRSIFFITTYFSDYILVPFKSRRTVTKALQQRGFIFSESADAFVSQLSPSSPTLTQSGRITSPFHDASMPSTPPAKDVPELQLRTFTKLKRSKVLPLVDQDILLISCAGSREYDPQKDDSLKNDLLQVLLSTSTLAGKVSLGHSPDTNVGFGVEAVAGLGTNVPDFAAKFLSVTLTSIEPISVLLEHKLLPRLGDSLLGAKSKEDTLIPITLDLRDLPLDATGIVCGVAGRLAQGSMDDYHIGVSPSNGTDGTGPTIDISFLSTARAGTVIVLARQLDRALDALEYGMTQVADMA